MAVTKIWAIHDSVSRVVDYCSNPEKTRLTDLEQVLIYAANKAKTLDEGEKSYAVTGVNCRAETAAQGDVRHPATLRQDRRQRGLPRLPVLQDRRGVCGGVSPDRVGDRAAALG